MGRERFQGGARLFQGCQRAGFVHAFLHQVGGVVIDLPEEELHQGSGVAQGLQTLLDQGRYASEKVEVFRRGELRPAGSCARSRAGRGRAHCGSGCVCSGR